MSRSIRVEEAGQLAMAQITFENVSKTYADGHRAVSSLNLAVDDGEFIVLVGPSGCGKSTALRMVAGLEDISEGQILVGGAVANDLSPRDRNIAMVFQSYALYPHLTVAGNIGFGLKVRGMPKAAIARKVADAARTLELSDYLNKKPAHLSGGQRQRVAMGRALVREPNAFLMDEPLSNLDARLRVLMRTEIARLQKMTGVTTLYVTHDQVEAMTMGDRVAVMDRGVLQQFGPPRVLYHEPANLFVANFIGSPAINLLEGKIVSDSPGLALSIGGERMPLPPALIERAPAAGDYVGRPVVVGVRPEALDISATDVSSAGALKGVVAFVEDLGASLLVHLDVDAPRPRIEGADEEGVELAEPSDHARLRTTVDGFAQFRTGDPVAVSLDLERIHLFDRLTGLAITARGV